MSRWHHSGGSPLLAVRSQSFAILIFQPIRGFPMKAWIPLTLVMALGTAAHAQAACTYPKAPEPPPDGNTATRDQMIAAKHDFDRYNGEMNTYLDCLKLEADSVAPKDTSKMTPDEKKKADEQSKI